MESRSRSWTKSSARRQFHKRILVCLTNPQYFNTWVGKPLDTKGFSALLQVACKMFWSCKLRGWESCKFFTVIHVHTLVLKAAARRLETQDSSRCLWLEPLLHKIWLWAEGQRLLDYNSEMWCTVYEYTMGNDIYSDALPLCNCTWNN